MRWLLMKQYLAQEDVYISELTCHHYMHSLGLKSIVRPHKPAYVKGITHTIFPTILNQQFTAEKPSAVWATDFTYLPLANGTLQYNYTIIDLYDRSAVATFNSAIMTQNWQYTNTADCTKTP